jgi:parallel beta-helix repeat protein
MRTCLNSFAHFFRAARRNILPLLIFFLSFVVSSASAATYYIDNSGNPPSSDSTTYGTEAKPWKTITYALARIKGGDTILIKTGTYNEPGLYIYGPSGTASAPTTLKAYPGNAPVLRGLGNSDRVAIDNVSYFVIDGLEITNLNQGIYIRNGSSNITIQNSTVHDTGQELIRVLNNCHDVLLRNNRVFNGGSLGGSNGEGFYIGTSYTDTVDNSYNITIQGNTIYNTMSEGIEFKEGTHDCIADGNTISTNNTGAVPASSIEVDEGINWNGNPNHVVRNNVIHDSGSGSHGIRAGTGCLVYNNIIYNINSSKSGIFVDNVAGDSYVRKIYNNTIDLSSARAISLSGGTADVKNNLGPTSANNLATNGSYYANAAGRDYHLVAGAAPIDSGVDLSTAVPVDIEGHPRPAGPAFDFGAYEYTSGSVVPPSNARTAMLVAP